MCLLNSVVFRVPGPSSRASCSWQLQAGERWNQRAVNAARYVFLFPPLVLPVENLLIYDLVSVMLSLMHSPCQSDGLAISARGATKSQLFSAGSAPVIALAGHSVLAVRGSKTYRNGEAQYPFG